VSDTVHRIVTERMITALERGTVPWRKPWQAAAGRPRSMGTGQPYRGVNVFLLGLTAAEEGYSSPLWGTYRQISNLGGQVRKGEHSTLVVFWKQAQAEQRDPQTGEITLERLPVLRYYRVFNAVQADHLPERFHPAPGEHREISGPQAVLDGYLAGGPQLVHVAGDRADYHPVTDTIRLPLRSQSRTGEGYYATAFHEAGHSTGHPTRLNRPGIADFNHFGSDKYAREELVAQMSSSLLCAQTGLEDPEIFENSASYIAGWLSALNQDTRLVVTAAAQAQRACDLINQAEREPPKDSDPRIEVVPIVKEHAPAETTAAAAGPLQASQRPDGRTAAAPGRRELDGQPRMAAVPEPQPSTMAADTTPSSPDARFPHHSLQAPMRSGSAEATRPTRASARPGDWQAEAD
jgi:antirestriction protein ArdC